jgi:hypothetical protein
MDMRRYHYTDIDPATGQQVFPGFTPPTNLYPDNSGKLVYRSGRATTRSTCGTAGPRRHRRLALDYHTKPLWITQP